MSYQPILFYPIVFHIMDIPNFNKIQRGLVDYIYQQRRKDPEGEKVSNQGGWQSKHYEGENIVVTAMKEAISSYFYSNKILKEGVSLDCQGIWSNINKKGNTNHKHCHPDSDFAGVMWIKTPPNCGDLEFENLNSFIQYREISCYHKEFQDKHKCYTYSFLTPAEGKIVIFPSCVEHLVHENKSNQDRISVAFNLKLVYDNAILEG